MCCEFLLPCPPALRPRQGFVCVIVLVVMVWLMLELQEYGGTSIQETEVVWGGGHYVCIKRWEFGRAFF